MTNKELKDRTQKFALDVIRFIETFPRTKAGDVLGKQLLRAACSVGANYRAACRVQSHTHFISKIGIVEEEADECLFWLELVQKSGMKNGDTVANLIKESNELTAIFTSSRKTARNNKLKNKSQI